MTNVTVSRELISQAALMLDWRDCKATASELRAALAQPANHIEQHLEMVAQPASEWKEPTDEQIHAADPCPDVMFDAQRIDFARAVLKLAKELNHD